MYTYAISIFCQYVNLVVWVAAQIIIRTYGLNNNLREPFAKNFIGDQKFVSDGPYLSFHNATVWKVLWSILLACNFARRQAAFSVCGFWRKTRACWACHPIHTPHNSGSAGQGWRWWSAHAQTRTCKEHLILADFGVDKIVHPRKTYTGLVRLSLARSLTDLVWVAEKRRVWRPSVGRFSTMAFIVGAKPMSRHLWGERKVKAKKSKFIETNEWVNISPRNCQL